MYISVSILFFCSKSGYIYIYIMIEEYTLWLDYFVSYRIYLIEFLYYKSKFYYQIFLSCQNKCEIVSLINKVLNSKLKYFFDKKSNLFLSIKSNICGLTLLEKSSMLHIQVKQLLDT